jgi:hypothetical protein
VDAERILLELQQLRRELAGRPATAYVSIAGAAAYTGLSEKHIRRAVKRGDLACSNTGGPGRPTYSIALKDIDAWMEAHRVRRAPPRSERDALVEQFFGKRSA